MDYKKIIKSRSMRRVILRWLSFIPDKLMLKIQYRIKMRRSLNLSSPKRFTEKMQWYKLYYKNPAMIQCVDKYEVREFVRSKGLEEILIPIVGVYDSVDDIPWSELPTEFVVKDTLGGGGNDVIICKGTSKTDKARIETTAEKWTHINAHRKSGGREWPYYSGNNHRIIIEKYLEPSHNEDGLIDYKFFCFDGRVQFLYVMGGRKIGESVKVSIFDRNFRKLPVQRVGDEPFAEAKKPDNFDEMIRIAEVLSADFPHVRIDLYNIDGRVYFGEMTFYNASGYMIYEPDSFDYKVGKQFILPMRKS